MKKQALALHYKRKLQTSEPEVSVIKHKNISYVVLSFYKYPPNAEEDTDPIFSYSFYRILNKRLSLVRKLHKELLIVQSK